MNFADYTGPGRPFRGSTAWAAAQIERLLEEEERRRRMAEAERSQHPAQQYAPGTPPQRIPSPSNARSMRANSRWMDADDAGTSVAATVPDDAADPTPPPDRGPMVINRAPRYRGELMPGLRGEPFLNNQEAAELAFSTIPVIGDAYGLYRDLEAFRDDPSSRTWGNYALTGASLLPFLPGGITKLVGKGDKTLNDVLEANPRTKIEDIPDDANGRLGTPRTRRVVIRVTDEFQRLFDRIEPNRFVPIAGGGRKERATQPVGYDGLEGRGLAQGAHFGDIVFLDTKTGKQYIIQIARVRADGQPLAEELDAAMRIARMPTRIPGPYREVESLRELPIHGEHTVFVVTPPADW